MIAAYEPLWGRHTSAPRSHPPASTLRAELIKGWLLDELRRGARDRRGLLRARGVRQAHPAHPPSISRTRGFSADADRPQASTAFARSGRAGRPAR